MLLFFGWLKRQFFCFFIASFLGVLSLNAQAIEVSLYEAEVPVLKTEAFNQDKLIKTAFEQVLEKTSGSSEVLQDPAFMAALKNINDYVTRFSYHQTAAGEKTLKVVFNQTRINTLLKQLHKTVLNKHRPLVLVWFKESEKYPELNTEMETILKNKGIPFVFPLMDLSDQLKINPQRPATETEDQNAWLKEAAKRYHPDVILYGEFTHTADQWEGRFWMIHREETKKEQYTDASLNTVLNQSVSLITQTFGKEDIATVDPAQTAPLNRVTLTVLGNLDATQYGRILAYLKKMPNTSEVEVKEIMPDKLLLDVTTTQTKEGLEEWISSDAVLRKSASGADFVYEVVG